MLYLKKFKLPSQGQIAYQLLKLLYARYIQLEIGVETQEAYEELGNIFNLTNLQKSEKYQSGKGKKWEANVRAAKHNVLKKTGLVINQGRGKWIISDLGIKKFIEMQSFGLITLN